MSSLMTRHDIALNQSPAHYFHLPSQEGSSRAVHMYHANAYPFGSYESFLKQLNGDVFGLGSRATWENAGVPDARMRWQDYADDLITFLECQNKGPVVGIGHSMGAVATCFAASRRPDLFSALVLIDPVFIPTSLWLVARSLWSLDKKRNVMAEVAERRPNLWTSREEAAAFHQSKRAFAAFSPDAMNDFGNHAITEQGNGFGLAFPREWEAHNYRTVPYVWSAVKSLTMPVLGIRGGASNVLGAGAMQKWKKLQPRHQLIDLEGAGHMAPQEAAAPCAELVNSFMNSLEK